MLHHYKVAEFSDVEPTLKRSVVQQEYTYREQGFARLLRVICQYITRNGLLPDGCKTLQQASPLLPSCSAAEYTKDLNGHGFQHGEQTCVANFQ